MRSNGIVMAKMIEFCAPKNFRNPLRDDPQLQGGKIIEFCSAAKKSASQVAETIWVLAHKGD